jgi:hypothetical protein
MIRWRPRIRLRTILAGILVAGLVAWLYVMRERRERYASQMRSYAAMKMQYERRAALLYQMYRFHLALSQSLVEHYPEVQTRDDVERIANMTVTGQEALDDLDQAHQYVLEMDWCSKLENRYKLAHAYPWMPPPSDLPPQPKPFVRMRTR